MSQIAADAPYVDLRREPYGVVVNDQLAAAHNTVAINAAIADHSGPGARLVMPTGVLSLEQANPGLGPAQRTWSIKGSPGTSNIRLWGQGWRQTKLIQAGVGTGGEWNGIVMDGVTGVSLEDFSIEQGTIDNPAYALHALIQIGAYSGFGTKDVSIRGVYFGQCIGDALRVLGDGANGPLVDTLLVDHFVMRTQGHPYRNAGLGQGSRSGISFQRGARNVIISNGYIEGAANSPFEMEPSGLNKLDNILIENVVINNSLGRTRLALALAGTVQNPLRRVSLSNVTVLEGVVQGAHTEDVAISNLHVHMSGNNTANAIADLTNAAMIYWHQDHKRTSLSNTHLTRESGSPAGPFVLISPTGKATGTITPVAGAQLVDGETITISDGVAAKIFEFDSGSGVAGGRVAVPFTTGSSTAQVRDALVTAVNAERGFRVTASNTTVDDKPATLLTNDDYGQHGNVAIVETVAAASFAVAGMAGGIGQTESMHFHSGVWTNKVGAGLGLKYFEASGCDHVSVSGVSMRLHAALVTEYGFAFRSIGDVDSPTLSDVTIESLSKTFRVPGAKLVAAAYFAATNSGAVRDVRVTELRAPSSCVTGMLLDINGGTSLDPQPVIQGCDFTGAADAWRAQNAAAGAVFPIVAGNRSGRCTVVGTVAPEGAVTALQGSLYVHQSGDSSELYFKASTTGPTGWQLLS